MSRSRLLVFTPSPYDERVWWRFGSALDEAIEITTTSWPGHGPPPKDPQARPFDLLAEAEHIAERTGPFDLVLVAERDLSVGIRLAETGHTRSIALLKPAMGRLLPEVDVADLDLDARVEQQASALTDDFLDAVERRDMPALATHMAANGHGHVPDADLALIRQVITDNADVFLRTLDGAYGNTWSAGEYPWEEQIAVLDVPVLVVATTRTPPDLLAERLSQALVDRCRHGTLAALPCQSDFPWLENPDALASIIEGFLRTLPPRVG